MMLIVFSLLCASLVGIGWWTIHRMRDEREAGGKVLTYLQCAASLLLFLFLPWWLAAMLVGALFFAGSAGVVAIGVVAAFALSDAALASVFVPLALLFGTRLRIEEYSKTAAVFGPFLTTVVSAALLRLPLTF